MADLIQFRRDTLERWNQFNPVLAEGEPGFILGDVDYYKIGDGIHAWRDLPLKGFNGNISEQLGDSRNSVISQHGMKKILKNIINNDSTINIENNWDKLDTLTTGIYVIMKDEVPLCHILVQRKNDFHIYQWIFGNFSVNDGNISESDDDIPTIIFRIKNNESWTEWKYFQQSFLIEEKGDSLHYSINQKFFTEQINHLLDEMSKVKDETNEQVKNETNELRQIISSFQNEFDKINKRIDNIENLL